MSLPDPLYTVLHEDKAKILLTTSDPHRATTPPLSDNHIDTTVTLTKKNKDTTPNETSLTTEYARSIEDRSSESALWALTAEDKYAHHPYPPKDPPVIPLDVRPIDSE